MNLIEIRLLDKVFMSIKIGRAVKVLPIREKQVDNSTEAKESKDDSYCGKCDNWKSSDSFAKNKRARDGLHIFCRECAAEVSRKSRRKGKEKKCRMCGSKLFSYKQSYCGEKCRKIGLRELQRNWARRNRASK